MNAIKNITIGHIERLYKPVGYTMLANLVSVHLTGADSRLTRPACGGYSALWLFICWSWLWRKGLPTAPISVEPTR